MLKELKFVQGAVARRDFVPAMTHFKIQDGFVKAYNGTLALCSPINFGENCIPRADELVKAIDKCEDTPVLKMCDNGKLMVQSGRARSFVNCIDGETPHVEPAGQEVHFDGEVLLKAVEVLLPFVGDDAARPWTNGILLRDQSAFATNNVTLVEYWLGTPVPFVVNIPRMALREMLRIGEPPTHAQLDTNSLTLHYVDGRWIRTQLLQTGWPDLRKVLDQPNHPTPVSEELFKGLDTILPFADAAGRVYIKNGLLLTQPHPEVEDGAQYAVDDIGTEGLYQIKMLSLLKGVATHADFSRYPDPVLFFGDRLRGALIGMRM